MARKIEKPTEIKAAGNKAKIIEEFIGNVNSGTSKISIARMRSPEGWIEPGQTPEFDEYTIVLDGVLKVELKDKTFQINKGQAVIINKNEWVRYSSPLPEGAEYLAVCLPAFAPEIVNRDE